MQASLYIDTFSIETRHTNERFYTLPSFSLLGATLAKIQYETTKQVESWLCRGGRPNFGSLCWKCCKQQDFPLEVPSNIKSSMRLLPKDETASCWIIRETIWNRKNPEEKAETNSRGKETIPHEVEIWSNP